MHLVSAILPLTVFGLFFCSVQMDVSEFFNLLLDKLEQAVRGTDHKSLLNDSLGGKLIHQVCSQDCCHVSEKFESFFALSLDVKNKQSVQAALELLVGMFAVVPAASCVKLTALVLITYVCVRRG